MLNTEPRRAGPANPVSKAWVSAALFLGIVAPGCAASETVMMQHPRTHEIAQCVEGYRRFIGGDGYRGQKECIADYERQGYQRAPVPAGQK